MTPPSGTRGFGIVGTGTIAAMHADAIAALPSARLAAVTDVDASAAAAFAASRGTAAERDLDALLARSDVDVVTACRPVQWRLSLVAVRATVIHVGTGIDEQLRDARTVREVARPVRHYV